MNVLRMNPAKRTNELTLFAVELFQLSFLSSTFAGHIDALRFLMPSNDEHS
jgi:hypothetical protein